jgi:hypothetical protein
MVANINYYSVIKRFTMTNRALSCVFYHWPFHKEKAQKQKVFGPKKIK